MTTSFECPNCGAEPHQHGRGQCRNRYDKCDGIICECYEDERSELDDHGHSLANPCTTAACTHCLWCGTIPKKPKGLQAWEKKALEAGWTMPETRKKELGL